MPIDNNTLLAIGKISGEVEGLKSRLSDIVDSNRNQHETMFEQLSIVREGQLELQATVGTLTVVIEKSSIELNDLKKIVRDDIGVIREAVSIHLKSGLLDKFLDFLKTTSGKIVLGIIAVIILGSGTVIRILQQLKLGN